MKGKFIRIGSQGVTSDPDVSRVIVTNRQRDLVCLQKVDINVFPEFASLSAASEVLAVGAWNAWRVLGERPLHNDKETNRKVVQKNRL